MGNFKGRKKNGCLKDRRRLKEDAIVVCSSSPPFWPSKLATLFVGKDDRKMHCTNNSLRFFLLILLFIQSATFV